jgi:tagatose 1,6-diphosphate aldolase
MQTKLTPGKQRGLEACADDRGVIAAAAMDQRGLLKNMMIKALGGKNPTDEQMSEFKEVVARNVTTGASAILLDVSYGLAATKNINGKGLLLASEKAGYSPDKPEKIPTLTEGWSAMRIREAGGDAVKILVYYNPFEAEWVNNEKRAWLERVGAECKAVDIPYFLEFLTYGLNGEDESSAEFAKKKPEIVIRTIEEFTSERYGADVLKLDVPINAHYVSGMQCFKGTEVYTRDEAKKLVKEAADKTDRPIVYLSAGVTNATFIETLEMAAEAGVEFHGVLAGRATWQEGVPAYINGGPDALDAWMKTEGAANIQRINETMRLAKPWYTAKSVRA